MRNTPVPLATRWLAADKGQYSFREYFRRVSELDPHAVVCMVEGIPHIEFSDGSRYRIDRSSLH